jgi:tRNA pseudouridine(38-40) synthase
LSSDLPGPSLLRALNGIAPEIWFLAAAPVDERFVVRHAQERRYRYFEPRAGTDPDRWRAAASWFVGEHDVRAFSRRFASGPPLRRRIDAITVRTEGRWLVVELRAPSFVWGMVRKIIAALRAFDRGARTERELREALEGRRPLTLPLAEPERLVLWNVEHGIRLPVRAEGPGRRPRAWRLAEAERAELRARLYRSHGILPSPTRSASSGRDDIERKAR